MRSRSLPAASSPASDPVPANLPRTSHSAGGPTSHGNPAPSRENPVHLRPVLPICRGGRWPAGTPVGRRVASGPPRSSDPSRRTCAEEPQPGGPRRPRRSADGPDRRCGGWKRPSPGRLRGRARRRRRSPDSHPARRRGTRGGSTVPPRANRQRFQNQTCRAAETKSRRARAARPRRSGSAGSPSSRKAARRRRAREEVTRPDAR
jgi:hypothetical protein